MTQKGSNISEALRRAKEEDVFLASLSKEGLEKSEFDTSTFGEFEYVNIYLIYDEDTEQYVIKYIFDGDPSQFYYERMKDVGGMENFMNDVEKYLALGGGE